MGNKVEIYTKDHCPYSQRAKDLLRIKGAEFVEYEISQHPTRADELARRSQHAGIPAIFVDNRLIGGCTDLFDLDERGELDALLGITPGGG